MVVILCPLVTQSRTSCNAILVGQVKIGTNIYRNVLVRLLQYLLLQQSLRRPQNHLRIQGYQIQDKGKPRQPLRDSLLQFLHCQQSQGQLYHQFRREPILFPLFEVSILLFCQGLPKESLGYPVQRPSTPFRQVRWSLIRKYSPQCPIANLRGRYHSHAEAIPL